MKRVLIAVLILCTFCVAGQAPVGAAPFASSITAPDLSKHLNIIAGKEMEGRETATRGQRRAAAYIEEQFRSMGLQPVLDSGYQQYYPVYKDSMVKGSLKMNGKLFEPFSDYFNSANSSGYDTLNIRTIVFAGYGISDSLHDDYQHLDVRGKTVLVMPGTPVAGRKKNKRRFGKPDYSIIQAAAKKNGAAILMIVDEHFPREARILKRYSYVERQRDADILRTIYVSEALAQSIMGQDYAKAKKDMKKGYPDLKSYGVSIELHPDKIELRLESSNVLAYLEGTDKKEEALIITAHYDHLGITNDSVIYYGADDDGSGVAAVLEIAEAFVQSSRENQRPRRSIIFMTVSGEEKGLWGSSYYAEQPAWPMDKTAVDLNIDMIGRVEKKREKTDTINYVYVIGDNRLSSDLRPISEAANNQHTGLKLDYRYNEPDDPERIFYRSDHYNFAKKGVPVIFYFSGLHQDYHRPTDTPDKINYDLLAKRTQLIFYTAWIMANREEMIKRDLP